MTTNILILDDDPSRHEVFLNTIKGAGASPKINLQLASLVNEALATTLIDWGQTQKLTY